MGHTNDVDLPPSAWRPFGSPEVLHGPAHTLKLTGGAVEDGVSEHGRLLESDPAQLSSRACWGHLHELVQGGGVYRG